MSSLPPIRTPGGADTNVRSYAAASSSTPATGRRSSSKRSTSNTSRRSGYDTDDTTGGMTTDGESGSSDSDSDESDAYGLGSPEGIDRLTMLTQTKSPGGGTVSSSGAATTTAAQHSPVGRGSNNPNNKKNKKDNGKKQKKLDAFNFQPNGQGGFMRGRGVDQWAAHDPALRLALDLKVKPVYCIGMGGALKSIRTAVSKKKKRFTEGDFDLDLAYITPKLIAMGFPSVGREGLYRNPMPEVQRFFETRHGGRYRIYNLCSERGYEPSEFLSRVARYPFDDHNPCPLHLIAAFCEDVDSWLNAHPDNVVSIHCKAGKGRTGLMISAYMVHCGFKASSEQALKWFGIQRTANGKGVTIPSQMRYVHYYESILRNGFPVTYTYRITHIRIRGVPAVEMGGGCAPWFQFFVDGAKIFDYKKAMGGTKGLSRFKRGDPYMDIDLTPFDLRVGNNVKFQMMHEGVTGTVKVCHLWFHTGFITRNYLVYGRNVIDKACKDKKGTFPRNFAIEFYMNRTEAMPLTPGEHEAAVATAKAEAAAIAKGGNNNNNNISYPPVRTPMPSASNLAPFNNNNMNVSSTSGGSGAESDGEGALSATGTTEKKKKSSSTAGFNVRKMAPLTD